MKRLFYSLLLITCLSSLSLSGYGQWLKKLKKTVKEIVAAPRDSSTQHALPTAAEGNSRSGAGSQDPNVMLRRPEAHGIEQLAAITVHGTRQYICTGYTAIENKDGQMVATIPIGTFTQAESLSELGEGSDQDQVQIFENDRPTRVTTAGALKKEKDLMAAHHRYDYPWGTELVRSASEQAGNYVKKGGGPAGMFSSIVFNNRKYGPYMIIGDLLVSKDRQRFFAQICPGTAQAEKGYYSLLGMDGTLRQLPTGGELIANLDFTSAAVMITSAALKYSQSMHQPDESKSAALQAEGSQLMQSAPNKGNVYFLNGKTLNNVLLSDGWLDQSGQNFFATVSENNSGFEKGTYLNGRKITGDAVKRSRGWTSEDGSSWAIEVDDYAGGGAGQLIFSDGTHIYQARDVHQLFVDGKYYMVWYIYNHKYADQLKVYCKQL